MNKRAVSAVVLVVQLLFLGQLTLADEAKEEASPKAVLQEVPASDCPKLFQSMDSLRCFKTPNSWIYASDEEEAGNIWKTEKAVEELFQKYFGDVPGRGVLFSSTGSTVLPSNFNEIMRENKIAWILPIVSPENMEKVMDGNRIRAQIRDSFRKQLGASLTDEQIDRMVGNQYKSIIKQLKKSVSSNGFDAFGHELGHMLFIAKYWPEFSTSGKNVHYGGPATDWLDELAAILVENAKVTTLRRKSFRDSYEKKELIPLDTLFTMNHPALKRLSARKKDTVPDTKESEGLSVSVEAKLQKGKGDGSEKFYNQLRAVADFMFEKSGNDKLFAAISECEKSGKTFVDWLAKNGETNNLPSTISALEQEFLRWCEQSTEEELNS